MLCTDTGMDYYEVLQVPDNATFDEIRRSYRQLVMRFHPDINSSKESTEIYKRVIKAYSTLKDINNRSEYDKKRRENSPFYKKMKFTYKNENIIKRSSGVLRKIKIRFINITPKDQHSKLFYDREYKNFFNRETVEMDIEQLKERLDYSQNIYVRINAIIALSVKALEEKRNKNRIFNILKKCFESENGIIKKACVWGLGKMEKKAGVILLEDVYNLCNRELKLQILEALAYNISNSGNIIKRLIEEFKENYPELDEKLFKIIKNYDINL